MDTIFIVWLLYLTMGALVYQSIDNHTSVLRKTVYAALWPLGACVVIVYFVVCLIVVAWEELK